MRIEGAHLVNSNGVHVFDLNRCMVLSIPSDAVVDTEFSCVQDVFQIAAELLAVLEPHGGYRLFEGVVTQVTHSLEFEPVKTFSKQLLGFFVLVAFSTTSTFSRNTCVVR